MLIIFWVIFNHSYNEKSVPDNIIRFMLQFISSKPCMQASDHAYVDTVDISIWRYKILEELGDGTCGSVFKAFNIETFEILMIPVSLPTRLHMPPVSLPQLKRGSKALNSNGDVMYEMEHCSWNLYFKGIERWVGWIYA
ncbi:hypothetical protein Gorai_021720 [Gossypium raimondii]|uniref:Protein kinase domain-containing protein n=1 Tax=Gossypium raimondii TaxID=29730 RepID=A0A7J8NRJ7_GOSRA|nr:hypothetical protein [Gossypium raimondii]